MSTNEPVHGPRQAAKKACIACAHAIPQNAKLCEHCRTYQDARRFLAVGNTTLAMLVALVAVTVPAAQGIQSLFWGNRSNVVATFHDLEKQSVWVMVSNSGDKPGFINRASIALIQPEGRMSVGLQLTGSWQVNPGETRRVAFSLDPQWQLRIAKSMYETRVSNDCELNFQLQQSNGAQDTLLEVVDCRSAFANLAYLIRDEIIALPHQLPPDFIPPKPSNTYVTSPDVIAD